MENPTHRATEAVSAYRNHFVGRTGPAARSIANRQERLLEDPDGLVNVRGPYLQALDVPNWSDESWRSFASRVGLNPLIRKTFDDLGFRRLYDFQERSIESIRDGHDTVVTAATGRGKTEAWLIPILDRILEKKRRGDGDGTTATLIYPTKALAQDQFKRLVQYLYRINEQWPTNQQITIGIYDGDTPTNMSANAQGYLESSFKYTECPGANEDLEKCRNCRQGVHVHNSGQSYELRPEKRQCTDDVPLDFIRLTKHSILTEGVDILLTNPDTINMKLVNVNAPDEHETFVYDPEFLVFDEVHTYDGLFGSYTATLTKRMRALREDRGCDDLQVIASSATVENDVELFQQISGATKVEHVDEQSRSLDAPSKASMPSAFTESTLAEEDLLSFARGKRTPPLLADIDFDIDAQAHDDDRLLELLGDHLFDAIANEGADTSPVVATFRVLHDELSSEPQTYEEFLKWIAGEFDLTETEAERVLDNFTILGTFSGLLENRTHLFSWPIDGFYACSACEAVYSAPQETCRNCSNGFVTRSTYCSRCDDEALVAWFCPSCEQLDPYIPIEEGERRTDEEHHCQRCLAARDEEVRSLRVTFQPTLECESCRERTTRSTRGSCSECATNLVHVGPDQYRCPNPGCESSVEYDPGCPDCGGDQRPVTGDGPVDCPGCGQSHEGAVPATCDCGRSLTQTRLLPWVCRKDSCDREYFGDPPDTCPCGSYTFARAGLFEVLADSYCESCETSTVGDPTCDCDGPVRTRETPFQAYQTVQPDGGVRAASSFSSVAPCTHQGLNYNTDRRYDELVRGPGNLAVTTSQYLLRRVADEEGHKAAKLLSFADSHRDMKEVNRDFSEPEAATLMDQTLVEVTRRHEPWIDAETVLDGAMELIEDLGNDLKPPQDVRGVAFDIAEELVDASRRHMDTEEAVRDRLRRRLYPHSYSGRYGEFGGALADDGLVDVRLDPVVRTELSAEEQGIVQELVKNGSGCSIEKIDPPATSTDVRAIVDDLDDRHVLEADDDYVEFDPSALEATLAGDSDDLYYRPSNGSYEQTIDAQFGGRSGDAVPSSVSIDALADSEHPRFTARAYRTTYSQPRMLVGQVYHGMTEKKERRELEYLFREGNQPHFLSTGPTMELGVDIGDLDALLLYGTPPNMNAYLQRIGRAGRDSGSSLVHSVSQRNPIDYYYYEQPADLMAADPQPVPLKEYNEEVLRVSLTWGVLDYVAANFVVPWEVERRGQYASVSGGGEFEHRQPSSDDDAAKLTHAMSARTKELGLQSRNSKLAALGTVVHDYDREIREHLERLLDHQYCAECNRKYDRDADRETCVDDNCSGDLHDALSEFEHLIDEAVERFDERFIDHYGEYRHELEDELENVQRRWRDLKRDRRRASSGEEARRISEERATLADRKEALRRRLDQIERMSYLDFLRESRQSRYAFNMRSVTNNVGVGLVDADEDGYWTRSIGEDDGRSMRMAISELHPGSAYLDGGDAYVVSQLSTDEFASSELRERVRRSQASGLAEEYVCPACGESHEDPGDACNCGSDVDLQRRRLVVPESVRAHRSDLLMSADGNPARTMYREQSNEIQNTYAERKTEVLEFNSAKCFDLTGEDGEQLGTVEYGSIDVLLHTDSFRAKYKSGEMDGETTPFMLCGDDDCPGVVYRDEDDQLHCSANADHGPAHDTGYELVRLGYEYQTDGIRVDLDDTAEAHTLVHGFRVALQYLGGVSIRELSEVVHGDGVVDLFDAQEGGAGVTGLLFESGDGRENFEQAISLLREHFQCDCDDGCPLCLYQYGCDTHNRGSSFDREGLFERLDQASTAVLATDGGTGIVRTKPNEDIQTDT
ncbi:DEAD/DEAH box helicase [Halostagnicola kamekurae]|uniref:DEAD/DEAH box helicase n=1 Tax=Halostagnicola kamekurae TaxID=619731 RepID=A0A1I6V7S3_9EURY|nr:DEAD/DEAH box helicase [Halostagnicola kamekurae]SFT09687.1 DEAD/DEAH box helicase [Halostagnicola kamekurae]